VSWRPFLPDPEPAYKDNADDPEPVPLPVLRAARELCAGFHVPPAQFRRRTRRGQVGGYWPATDIVAVDPDGAASDGLGGEDGYYVVLIEELLHATGHPSRLDRETCVDLAQWRREEATVGVALRTVLIELGFPEDALGWYASVGRYAALAVRPDKRAARAAAAWMLRV
jgi:antirestriction protein ArdC